MIKRIFSGLIFLLLLFWLASAPSTVRAGTCSGSGPNNWTTYICGGNKNVGYHCNGTSHSETTYCDWQYDNSCSRDYYCGQHCNVKTDGSGCNIGFNCSTEGDDLTTSGCSTSGPPPPPGPGATPTPGPEPGPETNVGGYHDSEFGSQTNASCYAHGWAADPNDKNQDVDIEIYSDWARIYSGKASEYRSDLTGECTGGTCAFNVNLWDFISHGVKHWIAVKVQDLNTDNWKWLPASNPVYKYNRRINCSITPTPTPTPPCPSGFGVS